MADIFVNMQVKLRQFSAGSVPNFRNKYSICNVVCDLQNNRAEFSKSCKRWQTLRDFAYFVEISPKSLNFNQTSGQNLNLERLATMLRYAVFFSGVVFCARKTLARSAFHDFQIGIIGFKRRKSV